MEIEHTNTAYSGPRALLRQGAATLGGPLVWLAQFELNYALVPRMCAAGTTNSFAPRRTRSRRIRELLKSP